MSSQKLCGLLNRELQALKSATTELHNRTFEFEKMAFNAELARRAIGEFNQRANTLERALLEVIETLGAEEDAREKRCKEILDAAVIAATSFNKAMPRRRRG